MDPRCQSCGSLLASTPQSWFCPVCHPISLTIKDIPREGTRTCRRCQNQVSNLAPQCGCGYVELGLVSLPVSIPAVESPKAENTLVVPNPCWTCVSCGYEYNIGEKCGRCKSSKSGQVEATGGLPLQGCGARSAADPGQALSVLADGGVAPQGYMMSLHEGGYCGQETNLYQGTVSVGQEQRAELGAQEYYGTVQYYTCSACNSQCVQGTYCEACRLSWSGGSNPGSYPQSSCCYYQAQTYAGEQMCQSFLSQCQSQQYSPPSDTFHPHPPPTASELRPAPSTDEHTVRKQQLWTCMSCNKADNRSADMKCERCRAFNGDQWMCFNCGERNIQLCEVCRKCSMSKIFVRYLEKKGIKLSEDKTQWKCECKTLNPLERDICQECLRRNMVIVKGREGKGKEIWWLGKFKKVKN